MRNRLIELILERSYRYNEESPFLLSSGRLSPYYIDCKQVTFLPEGQFLIGQMIFSIIEKLDPKGIGGMTLGADPIAISVSLISYLKNKPIPSFSVRKEPKKHGTLKWIEGNIESGSEVVVVDDVITTGKSTIDAIKRLREEGYKPLIVIVIVDREENNGKENIESMGIKVEPLFKLSELRDYLSSP
ncbi:MAG: orotate phosphoribosyltransferase [Candidatus Coatesbacteria bacterium]|nr:orotate phosphoribosyltransferase [Candidatus Coatesbacteria bacterium]